MAYGLTQEQTERFAAEAAICEEVKNEVVVGKRLLPQMLKMARRKAMALYKTTYIEFIAQKKRWIDCVDVLMMDHNEFYIMLHFNVGLPSHAVGYILKEGELRNAS